MECCTIRCDTFCFLLWHYWLCVNKHFVLQWTLQTHVEELYLLIIINKPCEFKQQFLNQEVDIMFQIYLPNFLTLSIMHHLFSISLNCSNQLGNARKMFGNLICLDQALHTLHEMQLHKHTYRMRSRTTDCYVLYTTQVGSCSGKYIFLWLRLISCYMYNISL